MTNSNVPALTAIRRFSATDLGDLAAPRQGPCVSLFAPMVAAGPETRQNRIRFKNLVREADRLLEERYEMTPEARADLLAPFHLTLDNSDFWHRRSHGLAFYRSGDYCVLFQVPRQLRELAVVQDRFHVGPLLPLLTGDGRYSVLALSKNSVRLFECTRDTVAELDLGETPRSLAEAVGGERQESHLQLHTASGRRGGGEGAPVYHGQGGQDDSDAEIATFLERVARGVETRVAPGEPLVLASVDYLAALFRRESRHDRIVEDTLSGSPDRLSAAELHANAWEIARPLFHRDQQRALARFAARHGTGLTTAALEESLLAAVDGRVDTLFVARGIERWGLWDEDGRSIEPAAPTDSEARELREEAAIHTLRRGGVVFAIEPGEMPVEGAAAAILRY